MHGEEVAAPRSLSPSPPLASRCPRCLHSDTLRRLDSATSATTTLNSYTPANGQHAFFTSLLSLISRHTVGKFATCNSGNIVGDSGAFLGKD